MDGLLAVDLFYLYRAGVLAASNILACALLPPIAGLLSSYRPSLSSLREGKQFNRVNGLAATLLEQWLFTSSPLHSYLPDALVIVLARSLQSTRALFPYHDHGCTTGTRGRASPLLGSGKYAIIIFDQGTSGLNQTEELSARFVRNLFVVV